MSYTNTETYGAVPSFLASEVDLRTVTKQIPQSMGVQDGKRLIVSAGTIFPANDATAIGIIFEPVDVTYGDAAGPVIVGGHVITARLPVAPASAAQSAMQSNGYGGITFEAAKGMVR